MKESQLRKALSKLHIGYNDTLVVRGANIDIEAIGKITGCRVIRIGVKDDVRVADKADFYEHFHHRVVDHGLRLHKPDNGFPEMIVDQADKVVELLQQLHEIKTKGVKP